MKLVYKRILFSYINIVVFSTIGFGQTLINGAESVAFDTLNNRYLVSSLNSNKIISIDTEGNQSLFKEGIPAFGNCIKDNILYVSGGTRVRGIDVSTAEIIMEVNVAGAQQLDGVTTDNSGNLYVVETIQNRIYKINLADNSVTQFASVGSGNFPQDIIFDKFNNRLLLVFWHKNSSVLSIDVETAGVDTAVATDTGFFDGITIDNDGNIYLASHDGNGKIIMYDNNFENPPAVISEGYDEPAGLDVNLRDNVLAIPSFAGNRVDFLRLPAVFLNLDIATTEPRGHIPHQVSFESISVSSTPVNRWEWDFDSDGTVDSYEENPTWTFNEPGSFSLNLKVYADTLVRELVLDDYIQAFNGNSSIEFDGSGGKAAIEASPVLALGETWTVSGWIKPNSFGRNMVFFKNALQIYTNNNPSSSLNAHSLVVRIYKEEGGFETFSTPDSSLIPGSWQHLAVSYNYTEELMGIYINGKPSLFFDADTNVFSSVLKNNEDDNIIIGNNLFGIRNFDGAIDNIELWKIYMNQESINSYMRTERSGDEQGLAGYWNMDDGSGTEIADITTNNNNGILENALFTHGVDIDLYTDVEKDRNNPVEMPVEFILHQNYPNPFNPETTIKFSLAVPSSVKLSIFNIQGELVNELLKSDLSAGTHTASWNGTDNNGLKVVSGVYLYTLSVGKSTESMKMILLK